MNVNRCSTLNCTKPSSIYCYQCEENFCEEHYENHQGKLISRFEFLQDENRFLKDKYRLINPNQLKGDFKHNLDEWRQQSIEIIEKLYNDKVDEALKYFRENFDRTENALRTLDERMATIKRTPPLTHDAIQNIKEGNEYVKKKIQTIEEKKIDIEIPLLPFQTSAGVFPFGLKSTNEFVLPEKSQIFSSSNVGSMCLCGNDKSLLICDDDSLLLLNENSIVEEKFVWRNGSIYHLSSIEPLKRFILINDRREIYLIDEKNLSNFERISTIPQMNWWSTTFFDKYLFLSTYGKNPIVVQADLTKSFQLIKQMKSPFLSSNEEIIQQLNTWNEKLIVIVSDQKQRISVCQVRSPFSFNLFSSISLNFPKNFCQNSIRSAILFAPVQRLVFIEENSSKIIVVALDGTTQMIDYQQPIRHVCSYRRTTLVIRTERNLIFYQL